MSEPTTPAFTPLVIAGEVLTRRHFNGDASEKRDAAATWLSYIEEGCSPKKADEQLRKYGRSLGFTPGEIATGAYVAAQCLKVGYSQTDRNSMTRLTVPANELKRVIEILDMRPNFVSGFGEPYQNGYVSRGASVITFANGEQLAIRLLQGDPRTKQIEVLTA